MTDPALERACTQVRAAVSGGPAVTSFFDEATFTVTHLVEDWETGHAAIIDPVLGYDLVSGRMLTGPADVVADHVRDRGLTIDWLLETHVHADHLSAADYLRRQLGGRTAIGRGVVEVQRLFAPIFGLGVGRDGSDFDHLFDDGEGFRIGGLEAMALHVPGHTPADIAYIVGNAAFPGDTVLMPDYGTARADFPGGDARLLHRSIWRLLSLPGETRLMLCHDYKAPGRDRFAWESTVAEQRKSNAHVLMDEDAFVAMRAARDATLDMPRLMLPAVQVNMHGGRLPDPEPNGIRYLKIPVDAF